MVATVSSNFDPTPSSHASCCSRFSFLGCYKQCDVYTSMYARERAWWLNVDARICMYELDRFSCLAGS